MRRILAISFVTAIVAASIWMTAEALRADPLPLQAPLPAISYRDAKGTLSPVRADPTRPTMVLLFHPKCGHCELELAALNARAGALLGGRLVLLTSDDSLFVRGYPARWRALAGRTTWGVVGGAEFREKFGSLLTPTIYVFSRAGRLAARFRGETSVDAIVAALDSSGALQAPAANSTRGE